MTCERVRRPHLTWRQSQRWQPGPWPTPRRGWAARAPPCACTRSPPRADIAPGVPPSPAGPGEVVVRSLLHPAPPRRSLYRRDDDDAVAAGAGSQQAPLAGGSLRSPTPSLPALATPAFPTTASATLCRGNDTEALSRVGAWRCGEGGNTPRARAPALGPWLPRWTGRGRSGRRRRECTCPSQSRNRSPSPGPPPGSICARARHHRPGGHQTPDAGVVGGKRFIQRKDPWRREDLPL